MDQTLLTSMTLDPLARTMLQAKYAYDQSATLVEPITKLTQSTPDEDAATLAAEVIDWRAKLANAQAGFIRALQTEPGQIAATAQKLIDASRDFLDAGKELAQAMPQNATSRHVVIRITHAQTAIADIMAGRFEALLPETPSRPSNAVQPQRNVSPAA